MEIDCSCGKSFCGSCIQNYDNLCYDCSLIKYYRTLLRLSKLDIKLAAALQTSAGSPHRWYCCPVIIKYLSEPSLPLSKKEIAAIATSPLISYSLAGNSYRTVVGPPKPCSCKN